MRLAGWPPGLRFLINFCVYILLVNIYIYNIYCWRKINVSLFTLCAVCFKTAARLLVRTTVRFAYYLRINSKNRFLSSLSQRRSQVSLYVWGLSGFLNFWIHDQHLTDLLESVIGNEISSTVLGCGWYSFCCSFSGHIGGIELWVKALT